MHDVLTQYSNKAFSTAFSRWVSFFGVMVFVIVVDQLLKYKTRYFGGFYICNSGISFGIRLPHVFFGFITTMIVLIVGFGCIYFYKKALFSPVFILGMALITGGALSNLLDRYFFGCVLDYLSFLGKNFPAFNFADISIFLGSCFVVWFLSTPSASKY